ncbi:Arc family DNA-binding protein [Mesorhizobium sp. B2-3-2]|uniref:FitA-like ribbon-helix-helix domain-containing protein n=1 Tax=Mesorhizobium sp. B2-3-2 TaxID=2589961 RepID=UPI00112B4B50|nr:Arc family DNA-binding protein [Mesorhizobium sp. B2-3-2]TPM37027.1 Arc family DNA-binding protein [Mesorhizobium sp. B2-3-2]
MPPQDRLTIHIRLSPSLIKQLKITAAENGQSMNAEIAARLERSFGPGDDDRRAAAKLLTEAISILDRGSGG